jgi:hypothetical protein
VPMPVAWAVEIDIKSASIWGQCINRRFLRYLLLALSSGKVLNSSVLCRPGGKRFDQ